MKYRKDQIEKGWTKAGKFVYQDNEVPDHGAGYHSAWDPDTQSQAVARFNAGSLFYKDMKGGISDVGGPGFIPRAGRKKKQTAEEAPPRPAPSVDSATSSEHAEDAEYSEYGSSQCPDEFIDAEGEEDEIIQALSDCQLGRGDPSRT